MTPIIIKNIIYLYIKIITLFLYNNTNNVIMQNNVIIRDVTEYINNEIGLQLYIDENNNNWDKVLPLYLTATYKVTKGWLQGTEVAFAQLFSVDDEPTVGQIQKHADIIMHKINVPVIFIFENLEAFKRKRLVQQKVNFIVPNKQLFIPMLMMNFTEGKQISNVKVKQLTPMAQVLVLYWLLSKNDNEQITHTAFNSIAKFFNTNAMAITRAVENLVELDLCTIHTGRPKYFNFKQNKKEIWAIIKEKKMGIHPVLKTVFTDKIPPYEKWLNTNINALAVYTDINPIQRSMLAIDNSSYQAYKKSNCWPEDNKFEGEYAIEIWKYNPFLLVQKLPWLKNNVDPLSLFINFTNDYDERIEQALVQIERKFIWLEE